MKEFEPYRYYDLINGNFQLFKEAVNNRETIYVYDIDGILANSPKIVFEKFTKITGLKVNPAKNRGWNYLTDFALKHGLNDGIIKTIEDYWASPELLREAQRYLYIKPVVQKTIRLVGSERNVILTGRYPSFKKTTKEWISENFPGFNPDNILIRKSKKEDAVLFKVENIKNLAQKAPFVVYFEDAQHFVQAPLSENIPNCLVVNIPLGVDKPDFTHERLLVIGRYPGRLQAMYPLMDALNRACVK